MLCCQSRHDNDITCDTALNTTRDIQDLSHSGISRWYRAGTGKQVHNKDRPVMEVLLLKDKSEDDKYFHLPSVQVRSRAL